MKSNTNSNKAVKSATLARERKRERQRAVEGRRKWLIYIHDFRDALFVSIVSNIVAH